MDLKSFLNHSRIHLLIPKPQEVVVDDGCGFEEIVGWEHSPLDGYLKQGLQ